MHQLYLLNKILSCVPNVSKSLGKVRLKMWVDGENESCNAQCKTYPIFVSCNGLIMASEMC